MKEIVPSNNIPSLNESTNISRPTGDTSINPDRESELYVSEHLKLIDCCVNSFFKSKLEQKDQMFGIMKRFTANMGAKNIEPAQAFLNLLKDSVNIRKATSNALSQYQNKIKITDMRLNKVAKTKEFNQNILNKIKNAFNILGSTQNLSSLDKKHNELSNVSNSKLAPCVPNGSNVGSDVLTMGLNNSKLDMIDCEGLGKQFTECALEENIAYVLFSVKALKGMALGVGDEVVFNRNDRLQKD